MSILKVAQLGHPVLRQVAEPVTEDEIHTDAFQRLCDDMLDTMDAYDGAGLAAPQVHVSKRLVVLTLSADRGPEFLVNPVIETVGDLWVRTYEGCLSVTGMRAGVDRPGHIIVQAMDRHGKSKAYELEGFPAVVVQHECDHLDGVLYVDRCDTGTLAFLAEYRRFGPLDQLGEDDEDLDDLEVEDEPEQVE